MPPLQYATCQTYDKQKRWVLDLNRVLKSADTRAVIIRRNPYDTLQSKLRNHCSHKATNEREHKYVNSLIVSAVRRYPQKTLLLDYDYMDDELQWERVTRFVNTTCPQVQVKFRQPNATRSAQPVRS